MKKNFTSKALKFIPLIFAFCLFCNSHAWASANNIRLTTQSEVDNFVATYSSTCIKVTGYLEIGKISSQASVDIHDVSGLSFLTEIDGDLRLWYCPVLFDLTGLDNITNVTGHLSLIGRHNDFEGLEGITTVGGSVLISNCPFLTKVKGLDNLQSIGDDLSIQTAPLLAEISDLSSLTSIEGDLDIGLFTADELTSLNGLQNVTSIGGNINIQNAPKLVNITSLSGITNVPGFLQIAGTALTDLSGLQNITNVSGDVNISQNASMTSLNSINGLTTIGGGLTIQNCNALTTLGTGFTNLTTLGGSVRILLNSALTNINALASVASVASLIEVNDCDALTNLGGFGGVGSVGGGIRITNNDALTVITFNNLTSTNSFIRIDGNAALQTIGFTGLITMKSSNNSSSAFALNIENNASLTNIIGFNDVIDCENTIRIKDNPSLTMIQGFSSMATFGGGTVYTDAIEIENNDLLTSIIGFSNLTSCEAIRIIDNDELVDITPLNGITNLWNEFTVENNPKITTISFFTNLNAKVLRVNIKNNAQLATLVGPYNAGNPSFSELSIEDNLSLTSIAGISGMTYSSSVYIKNNPLLANLTGLEQVTFVGDVFVIEGNTSLQNLLGLAALDRVEYFKISDNDALLTLNGLENLDKIQSSGDLILTDNAILNNLTSIATLNFESNTKLVIEDNPNLAFCEVASICNFIYNNGGSATVNNNDTGCNTKIEVLNNCNTCTWICSISGDWSNAGCWSCGDVPISKVAIMKSGDEITLNQNASLDEVMMEGGMIKSANSSSLTVNQKLTWQSGSFELPVTVANAGELIIETNDSKTLKNTLTLNGTTDHSGGDLNIDAGGNLINASTYTFSSGNIALSSSGIFTNNGTFNATSSGTISGGATEKLINGASGIFNKSNSADLNFISEFENSGTLNLNSGKLTLSNLNWQGGTFNGTAGTELVIDSGTIGGALTTQPNVFLTKETSGVLTVNSTLTSNGIFSFNQGTLAGSGSISFKDMFWATGDLAVDASSQASGTLTLVSNSPKDLNGDLTLNGNTTHTGGKLSLNLGSSLTNNGDFDFFGGEIELANGINFANASGSNFNANFDGTIDGTGGIFDNDGTFSTGSSAFSFTINSDFDNSGTFDINGGSFPFIDINGNFEHSGTLNIEDFAAVNLLGGGTISAPITFGMFSGVTAGGGTLNINTSLPISSDAFFTIGGSTVTGSGDFSNSGFLSLGSGTLDLPVTVNSGGTIGLSTFKGVTTSVTKPITISSGGNGEMLEGEVQFGTGGSVQNAGTFSWLGGNLDLSSGATFNNSGTLKIEPFLGPPGVPAPPFDGEFKGTGSFNNSGTLENNLDAAATNLNFKCDVVNTGIVTQINPAVITVFSGDFNNNAGSTLMGKGTYTFSGAFTNDGTCAPGNSPGILAVNTFENSGSDLTIEINDDTGAGVGHDQLQVSGTATIDGTLTIPQVPSTDNSWVILTCGTCTGTFSTINYPGNATDWSIQYNANDITVTYSGVLPVELIDFQVVANENSVLLNWSTASETNNEGFEILKSENGFDFEKIGWIAGAGNSFEQKNYIFEDENVRSGATYFYKLKQVDFDGAFEFSKVVSIEMTGENDFLLRKIFPNPISEGLSPKLNLNLPNDANLNISIFSLDGKTVFEKDLFLQKGNQIFEIEKTNFVKGSYFLKIQIDEKLFYKKLIVN